MHSHFVPLFSLSEGLDVGAVVNDSPVGCQSRERPSA